MNVTEAILLIGSSKPPGAPRSAVEPEIEWIEAPAPAEDLSVPPELDATPPVGARELAIGRNTGRMRSNPPL